MGWPATVLQGDPFVIDRWQWLRRRLRPGPLRTLDAGCGRGAFTLYAGQIGNHAVGLSFSDDDVRVARQRADLLGLRRVEFHVADLRRLDRAADPYGRFDQIICTEVIEHIRDDAKLIDDLSRLLRPGGRLLLTTPYENHVPLLWEEVSDHEDGRHVRFGYTWAAVEAHFARCGLAVEERSFLNGLIAQQLFNLYKLAHPVHPRLAWAVTVPFRPLHAIDALVTETVGYPFMSVGLVGIKREGGRP
jgi:SAM-dependent methyltransferase